MNLRILLPIVLCAASTAVLFAATPVLVKDIAIDPQPGSSSPQLLASDGNIVWAGTHLFADLTPGAAFASRPFVVFHVPVYRPGALPTAKYSASAAGNTGPIHPREVLGTTS